MTVRQQAMACLGYADIVPANFLEMTVEIICTFIQTVIAFSSVPSQDVTS